jgi:hypothetical protein
MAKSDTRPVGITALSIFFSFGAVASFVSFMLLLFPGSFLEPMWRLNPRAREGLTAIGVWGIALMCTMCVACAAAAVGMWRGLRWAYWVALELMVINLLGDITNVVLGIEPRAVIGIPIALAIILFLVSRRVRKFFVT